MADNVRDACSRFDSSLNDVDPSGWLLEEYKLLSSHYFHEDNQFWKTVSIFGALNTGLLAFLGSNLVSADTSAQILVPLVGIALCFAWLAALIRLRSWRNYVELRIEKIETYMNSKWNLSDFTPLDIRRMSDWETHVSTGRLSGLPYRILRNLPSSITLMILPMLFTIVWISSIVLHIATGA